MISNVRLIRGKQRAVIARPPLPGKRLLSAPRSGMGSLMEEKSPCPSRRILESIYRGLIMQSLAQLFKMYAIPLRASR
jgi:hypothetical protein